MVFDVLQCNYEEGPVLTGRSVVLNWNYKASHRQGVRQVSFCVDVSECSDFSSIVFSSSTIVSADMHFTLPDAVLEPASRYFWRVTSQDNRGMRTVSRTQEFETALFESSLWERLNARWITCGVEKENEPDAPIFFLDVDLPDQIVFARAYVYGLGWQQLQVNGQVCTDWLLAPPNTKYDQRCLYETYRITDCLVSGRNRFEIMLGNGYNANYSQYGWRWFGPKGVRAIFLLRTAECTHYLVTDENWCWRDSPIRSCDIYNGETYDARFFDGSPATVKVDDESAPDGSLQPNEMPHVTIYREIEPLASWSSDTDVIFDFGVNAAGFVRIQLEAPRGHEISLQYSELIGSDGSLTPITNRDAKANDRYICSGDGLESYQPRFTYHGFRYVAISGLTDDVSEFSLVACLISADLETSGAFRCSDPLINRIHQMMLNSMRSNFVTIPTDCPSRDERTPCQMDSQFVEAAAMHNFNMNSFYRKWLGDIAGSKGNPDWSGDQIALAWRLYWHYGDLVPADLHYAELKSYLLDLERNSSGMIWTKGYGDWCHPNDNVWESFFGSVEVVNTCLFFSMADKMRRLASALGKADDAMLYRDMRERIRQAFLHKFLDLVTGRISSGRQTEQIMPLYFELIPPEHEHRVAAALVERISEDGSIGTGAYGTQYILQVLASYGYIEVMDRLLQQSEYPSFGWQIANGATSLWEQWAFDGIMHSHNHAIFAGMDAAFYQVFAGIKAAEPGYRRFTVQPVLPESMRYVHARLQTVSGLIEVMIEKISQGIAVSLKVPQNTAAVLYLPVTDEVISCALLDGERRIDLADVEVLTTKCGSKFFELAVSGGNYRFRLLPKALIHQRSSIQ